MSEQVTEPPEPGEAPEPEEGTPHEPGEEPEHGDEPEPEPEPEPEAEVEGLTPEALDRRASQIEQAFKRFASKVSELYGDEAVRLLPCPLCPDQHKGFVHLDFAGRVPQEVVDATKLYLGIAREQDYESDPGTNACQVCAGKGKVKTGSTVPGHEVRTCPSCKGYGYSPPPTATQTTNGAESMPVSAEAVTEALQSQEDVDEWGEPRILPDGRENPNFGKMPNRKVLVEPYGITANLTALDVTA